MSAEIKPELLQVPNLPVDIKYDWGAGLIAACDGCQHHERCVVDESGGMFCAPCITGGLLNEWRAAAKALRTQCVELVDLLHSENQVATNNADWFDQLLRDLSRTLNCPEKPSIIMAKVEALQKLFHTMQLLTAGVQNIGKENGVS